MPVYLQGGAVLLSGGSIATNAACCCVTGACCADDGTCTITTEAGCLGTYQGNGTDCDPNPCPIHSCCCIDAFHGPDNWWTTQTCHCDTTVDLGGSVPIGTKFYNFHCEIDGCAELGCTGSVTCDSFFDCDGAHTTCSGEIICDGMVTYTTCGVNCPVNVSGTGTYSAECICP